ncbi:adenylate/guanylate cyclase domain-containing protein [Roseospirillum parvum]|uniref:Adenylate cyclase n=1 Tax=Roseospirillum parvum TaxID=83401 RepID=A0A1G8CZL2_9PROT|nr:adenylate/guanylate cyclase domain-containing protein [Roseospirillum parvum]SDH50968.1 adenylate cyclase [Roseospirillum parvum]
MPPIVHFEVYLYQRRGWTLHTRFTSFQRDRAIEEAKALERHLGVPTKVVREIYDSGANVSDEAVVYLSPKIREVQAAPARATESYEAFSEYGPDGGLLGGSKVDQVAASGADLVLRMVLVIFGGLALAAGVTVIGSFVLGQLPEAGVALPPRAGPQILFVLFLGSFLVSTLFMVLKFVPLGGIADGGRPGRRAGSALDDGGDDDEDADWNQFADLDEDPEKRPGLWARLFGVGPTPEPEPEPPPPPPKPTPEPEPEPEPEPDEDDDWEEEPVDEAPDAVDDGQQAAKGGPPAVGMDVARQEITRFLGGAVNVIKSSRPQLDAFNKFGVNLFLAGAAEALSLEGEIDDDGRQALIRQTVEMVGTKPALAQSFVERLDEYVMEARYMHMIQSGREAMELHLAGNSDPFANLTSVLDDWNNPQAKQTSHTIMAIVFTDMVGSTGLTQELGDVGAQEAVRAHNTIVRSALSRHDGREVKHTGDGIMATFSNTVDAVEAMIDVQRAVIQHNQRAPGLPLGLKVGINCGEPVVEGNDYFGTAVQLAARVCDRARQGQIWCTGVVKELCAGKTVAFHPRGPFTLKGIKEPQHLFEVVWSNERAQEIAAELPPETPEAAAGTTPPASPPGAQPADPPPAQSR